LTLFPDHLDLRKADRLLWADDRPREAQKAGEMRKLLELPLCEGAEAGAERGGNTYVAEVSHEQD
jgi:hypothetical protein